MEVWRKSALIDRFMREGCGCAQGDDGEPCSLHLTRETYRSDAQQLCKEELDLVIMMAIRNSFRSRGISFSIRSRWEFFCDGGRYCLYAFTFLHGISKSRFYEIAANSSTDKYEAISFSYTENKGVQKSCELS